MIEESFMTAFSKAMKSAKRPSKVVDFPGVNGLKVGIVVPTDQEIADSQACAIQYLTKVHKLDEFQLSVLIERDLYSAEEQRQLLSRVLRDPTNSEMSFATLEELREWVSPDQRRVLLRHIESFIEERSPETKLVDPEKAVAFVRDLKEAGGLSDYLTSCDFGTLVCIAISLAEALPKQTEQPY